MEQGWHRRIDWSTQGQTSKQAYAPAADDIVRKLGDEKVDGVSCFSDDCAT